jgi:hypothetical protein
LSATAAAAAAIWLVACVSAHVNAVGHHYSRCLTRPPLAHPSSPSPASCTEESCVWWKLGSRRPVSLLGWYTTCTQAIRASSHLSITHSPACLQGVWPCVQLEAGQPALDQPAGLGRHLQPAGCSLQLTFPTTAFGPCAGKHITPPHPCFFHSSIVPKQCLRHHVFIPACREFGPVFSWKQASQRVWSAGTPLASCALFTAAHSSPLPLPHVLVHTCHPPVFHSSIVPKQYVRHRVFRSLSTPRLPAGSLAPRSAGRLAVGKWSACWAGMPSAACALFTAAHSPHHCLRSMC